MHKSRKNNPWIYFTYTQLAPNPLYISPAVNIIEQNMLNWFWAGWQYILKISDWAVKYATIEVKFLIFFKYCSVRTKKLHNIKVIFFLILKK